MGDGVDRESDDVVDQWHLALSALAGAHADATQSLIATVDRLRAAGGALFEVISGAPALRYGARLTFRPVGDRAAFAVAGGLADHPWGPPDWIGVRTSADGTTRAKAYHRRPPSLDAAIVHRGLPPGSEPVMASLDGDAIEVYAVHGGQLRWDAWVARCLPIEPDVPPTFTLVARARGFGLSVRQVAGEVSAVTLFAFPAALPPDERVTAEWTSRLSAADAVAHETALAAVASLGHRVGRRYGLLGWTYELRGFVGRAASLRCPPPR